MSYTQLNLFFEKEEIFEFYDILLKSEIHKIEDYDYSVEFYQIKLDKNIRINDKKKVFDKIRIAAIRQKYNCFYNNLKLLVNDKSIKLSNLTDKFRKLDLDGQINLFDKFQKKYYLLKVEISGKLIDVVNNIESSCMIVFNVGSGLTHTLFIDKDIDKRWKYIENDETFN